MCSHGSEGFWLGCRPCGTEARIPFEGFSVSASRDIALAPSRGAQAAHRAAREFAAFEAIIAQHPWAEASWVQAKVSNLRVRLRSVGNAARGSAKDPSQMGRAYDGRWAVKEAWSLRREARAFAALIAR